MSTKRTRLVQVYGSLLNSEERKPILEKGIMKKLGTEKRSGWKLSFDRCSSNRKEAVLNFVNTGNSEDVYYTTIFKVDDNAYCEVMKREMGKDNAEKWKQCKLIPLNAYRPKTLDSSFDKTEVFLIPEEERKPTQTHWEADYVKIVREGIGESYKDNHLQLLEPEGLQTPVKAQAYICLEVLSYAQ